jgi:hypothetical protein
MLFFREGSPVESIVISRAFRECLVEKWSFYGDVTIGITSGDALDGYEVFYLFSSDNSERNFLQDIKEVVNCAEGRLGLPDGSIKVGAAYMGSGR